MLVVLQTGRIELIIADLHKVCKNRVGKRYRESDQVLNIAYNAMWGEMFWKTSGSRFG